MEAFGPTDLFLYMTTERKSMFFPFSFEKHESFMLLLNFWGAPNVWGDNARYNRMGQDKFYKLTDAFITKLEDVGNKIKQNPHERHSKALVNDFVKEIKKVGAEKFIAITRFCSPQFSILPKGRIELCVQVLVLNQGGTLDDAQNHFKTKYQPLLDVYDIEYMGATKQIIGKSTDRTCRFCNRKESDGIKFGDKAHAIPKAVGNNMLFCNEECNECNHEFGENIETDFSNYFLINRILYKINNRSKNIIIGENFCSDEDGNIFVDEITEEERLYGQKQLICKETITVNSLYRALSKFVINLIDERHLPEFRDTISWIKGKLIPAFLPPVITAICAEMVEQPYIQIFTRKQNAPTEYPYCFALIQCIDLAFLFVMPLAYAEQGEQLDKQFLDRILPLADPFIPKAEHVNIEDMNSTEPRYVWKFVDVNRLIVVSDLQKKKGELHKPSKDAKLHEYVEFPPLSIHNIKLEKHEVINYEEHCPQAALPKEEYLNTNLHLEHSLYILKNMALQFHSVYDCETYKRRKMFHYEQVDTYRLHDPYASIKTDKESISIDINLVRELIKRSTTSAHTQLNEVYQQHVQLLPIKDTTVDYTISNLRIFIELSLGKRIVTNGSKLWNIKYLHI